MMSNGSNGANSCTTKCWMAGSVFGLLVIVILVNMAGWNLLISLAVGSIGALGAAWVLTSYFCEESVAQSGIDARSAPAEPAVEEAIASDAIPDQNPPADDAFADEAPADPEPAEEVAESGDDAEAGKPMLYAVAPDSADDLKKIKGVGPALEKTLNDLGVYTYAQVAAWSAEDIAWVDGNLKFKGRIERDDWRTQAKAFTADGDA